MAGALGDLDGDGRSEVTFDQAIVRAAGAAGGGPSALPDMPTVALPAGDYNGDGVGDVLLLFASAAEVRARVRGGGTLATVLQHWIVDNLIPFRPRYPQPAAILTELDGDLHPELAIDTGHDVVVLYTAPGTPWLRFP